ncbi:MAG TPA: proton-conducting transporter membrane subunit, partial [Gemmataceae bacterium]|nr:proton-conducting transporter membrane subunit [Gemmataceae bacterium]
MSLAYASGLCIIDRGNTHRMIETMDLESVKVWMGLVVILAPAILVAMLGVSSVLRTQLSEQTINRSVQAAIFSGLIAAIFVLALMLLDGSRHVVVMLGDWVAIPDYEFRVKFVFDRLSVPMAILSFMLTGTVGAFASRYMHRESGYNRFFFLYTVFVLGMVVTSLAGTVETLFTGWELVGLSSALLVAYYQERPAPARNGLWVWIVYRVSDAALLLAAVVLHHMAGEGDFDHLLGHDPWPDGHATINSTQALVVGLLFLVAAAGKSGLVPFSGWLPRAMEGPTPSSAIFYGALSVHLGAFLLLRVSP